MSSHKFLALATLFIVLFASVSVVITSAANTTSTPSKICNAKKDLYQGGSFYCAKIWKVTLTGHSTNAKTNVTSAIYKITYASGETFSHVKVPPGGLGYVCAPNGTVCLYLYTLKTGFKNGKFWSETRLQGST